MPAWVWRVLEAAQRVPWAEVWAAVLWLSTLGRKYWDRLDPKERREVLDLMMKSRGERSNLTRTEQIRLFRLFQKVRRA
jgi:hypothetical protein